MFFSSAYLSMFYILYLEINKVAQVEILCKNMDGINSFIRAQESKFLGKMRLSDQNNGKKIGISGPWINHVTTLI